MLLNLQRQFFAVIISFFLILLADVCIGQGLTRKERIKGRQPPGRESLKCSTLIKLNKQRTAIGVRLGSPMALTIKTYNKKLWSFEVTGGVSFGTTFSNTSIGSIFRNNQPKNVNDPTYISHRTSIPLMVQLKLIRHFKFVDLEHLMGFGSVGVNVNSSTITYVYRNQETISTGSVSNPGAVGYDVSELKVDVLGVGPEMQVGIEYYFKSTLPFVAHFEGGAYYDVKNPDTRGLVFIGGAGLRYYF